MSKLEKSSKLPVESQTELIAEQPAIPRKIFACDFLSRGALLGHELPGREEKIYSIINIDNLWEPQRLTDKEDALRASFIGRMELLEEEGISFSSQAEAVHAVYYQIPGSDEVKEVDISNLIDMIPPELRAQYWAQISEDESDI